MKVCPKCGFVDRSSWRQNRWRTNVEFLKYLEHPEGIEFKSLERLKSGHPVALDKLHAYRFSGEVVERVLRIDYDVGSMSTFHIPREHVDHKRDPWQSKLAKKEVKH